MKADVLAHVSRECLFSMMKVKPKLQLVTYLSWKQNLIIYHSRQYKTWYMMLFLNTPTVQTRTNYLIKQWKAMDFWICFFILYLSLSSCILLMWKSTRHTLLPSEQLWKGEWREKLSCSKGFASSEVKNVPSSDSCPTVISECHLSWENVLEV